MIFLNDIHTGVFMNIWGTFLIGSDKKLTVSAFEVFDAPRSITLLLLFQGYSGIYIFQNIPPWGGGKYLCWGKNEKEKKGKKWKKRGKGKRKGENRAKKGGKAKNRALDCIFFPQRAYLP